MQATVSASGSFWPGRSFDIAVSPCQHTNVRDNPCRGYRMANWDSDRTTYPSGLIDRIDTSVAPNLQASSGFENDP